MTNEQFDYVISPDIKNIADLRYNPDPDFEIVIDFKNGQFMKIPNVSEREWMSYCDNPTDYHLKQLIIKHQAAAPVAF
jgi:hypothetical protein